MASSAALPSGGFLPSGVRNFPLTTVGTKTSFPSCSKDVEYSLLCEPSAFCTTGRFQIGRLPGSANPCGFGAAINCDTSPDDDCGAGGAEEAIPPPTCSGASPTVAD